MVLKKRQIEGQLYFFSAVEQGLPASQPSSESLFSIFNFHQQIMDISCKDDVMNFTDADDNLFSHFNIEGMTSTNKNTSTCLTEPQATFTTSRNNYRIKGDEAEGGLKTKCRHNLDAIRTLKKIEEERRCANATEQEILAKYVGWGGLPQAFSGAVDSWELERTELQELLTEDEYKSARGSTLNAHYTAFNVISFMYKALNRLGFKHGRILEPSMGIGNFFGLLPEEWMNSSLLTGIELDSLTGRIAKCLYPNADIRVEAFEASVHVDNYYDLVVSNVPFGDYKLYDPRYNKLNYSIHDYFFAKSLDLVREGGLVCFITSKFTMDKLNDSVRRYIDERASLIGSVRLPNTAFKRNANTEVTTDIIFLKKRTAEDISGNDWINVHMVDEDLPLNEYYINNPNMMLGNMVWSNKMYGAKLSTLNPFEDKSLDEALNEVLLMLPEDIYSPSEYSVEEDGRIPADLTVKNYAFVYNDGRLLQRVNQYMEVVEVKSKALERMKGMIAIKDAVREVIKLQMQDVPDSYIGLSRSNLNYIYDTFVKKYGYMKDRENKRLFKEYQITRFYYLLNMRKRK